MQKSNENKKSIFKNKVLLKSWYLILSLILGIIYSVVWTPRLMRPAIIVEMDYVVPEATLLHFWIATILFTFVFAFIGKIVGIINEGIKIVLDSKFHMVGALTGKIFAILIAVESFRLTGLCGNTTFFEILVIEFVFISFWAFIGFLGGLLISLVFEKSIYFLENKYR